MQILDDRWSPHSTGKKEEPGKLEEQEQLKSPARDTLQSLTWHRAGSGGALRHVQPWAESFREQTGTQHCGLAVAADPSQVPYTVIYG